MKTLPFTFAILLLSATGGFAASFVDDFSTTGNPSSGWEYGGFATSFNPASTATWIWNKKASQYTTSDYGGGTGWRYAPEDLATYEGIFLLNNGLGVMCASASVGGYATAPAVRYTIPTAGTYALSGSVTDALVASGYYTLDGGWYYLAVLSGTTWTRLSDAVFGDAAGPANVTFDITTDLKAGDVVYLIVDGRDRNGADWHRVDYLTIGSIPEPATMGLFAAGGLAALLRRKRG